MRQILILSLVLAVCQGLYLPETPHSEYGVPHAYLKNIEDNILPTVSNDYGVPKDILPVEVYAPVSVPHDSYGIPKEEYAIPQAPIATQYEYVIPHVEPVATPVPEYGVPKIYEEYGVPAAPKIHEEYGIPNKPHDEYGVPEVKAIAPVAPVETKYEYVIPYVEPVAAPVPEYGVPKMYEEYGVPAAPKIHEEYGVPNKPHDEYGVPEVKSIAPVAPVETKYEYVIPHIEPVAAPIPEYGVPKIYEEYGVPAAPKIHEEYGVPNKPHDEYGVPEVKSIAPVAPVETKYEYVIPHIEPVAAPIPEYGVPKIYEEYGVPAAPKIHEEYGVPNKPHDEYGVPEVKSIAYVAPVETKYEYVIPHIEPVAAPIPEYGVPKIYEEYGVPAAPKIHEEYGVPNKPHDEYGVPEVKSIAPVAPVETKYEYVIPHVEPVAAPIPEYGVPKIYEEYGVPAAPKIHEEYGVPNKPHDEYGVPEVKAIAPIAPVETKYEYVIPYVEPVAAPVPEYGVPKIYEEYGVPAAPKIHEEYGVPNKPHDEYGVPEVKSIAFVAPVETKYEYVIPHVETTRAPEPLPKIHEEYGVPSPYAAALAPEVPVAVPHSVYGVPAL